MQKKSLLVALFCGALCLTGCLKNEESASVALVRGAKAEELKSLAALNNAKAAAEAVYAEAELTVAKAEAELRKAQAALILAQAETEKVRAELLKVRVALAEVKVDEERVKLQMLEADLEQKLAEVEAAVAKAEAEKQGWINVLEHAIAAAEAQAITDAQAILEAEQALEAAVLKMEKAQADSAKKAANRYFDALDYVQTLQQKQLVVKAQKVLVENGAKTVRDVIYYEIDEVNKQIARNNEIVAYLKEHQTDSPEKAEADLKAAHIALEEAYNKYQDAVTAESKAQTAYEAVQPYDATTGKGKTADFIDNYRTTGWYQKFMVDIQSLYHTTWGHEAEIANYYHGTSTSDYDPVYTVDVKVGNGIVKVKTSGLAIPNEEAEDGFDFLPLWSYEDATNVDYVRYPDVDVYSGTAGISTDFVPLANTAIAPAILYYDNIKTALDTAIAVKTRETAKSIENAQKGYDRGIKVAKNNIELYNNKIALHELYVEAYQDTIDKYEAAFLDSLAKAETYETNMNEAWRAFQEYMLLTYPENISRQAFINRYVADTTYQGAKRDSLAALRDYNTKKAGLASHVTAVKTAFENFATAEGNYNGALAKRAAGGDAYDEYEAMNTYATTNWNPKFAAATAAEIVVNNVADSSWKKVVAGDDILAGKSQNEAINAQKHYDAAKDAWYKAKIDLMRFPEGTEGYSTAKTAYDKADATYKAADTRLNGNGTTIDGALAKEIQAGNTYQGLEDAYKTAMGTTLIAALEAWNPEFPVINTLCTFPTEVKPTIKFTLSEGVAPNAKGEWIVNEKKAASAQKALLDVVKAGAAQEAAIAQAEVIYGNNESGAKGNAIAKKNDLDQKSKELIAAFKHITDPDEIAAIDLKKDKIEDYLDTDADELYQAYLDAKEKNANVQITYDKLHAKYLAFDPDVIGMISEAGVRPEDNKYTHGGRNTQAGGADFGWLISSYHVDYMATMLNVKGKKVSVAKELFPPIRKADVKETYPYYMPEGLVFPNGDALDVTRSFQYKAEDEQNNIDVVLPAELATSKDNLESGLENFKTRMSNILTVVNSYKPLEAGYKSWITERENAEKAVNEAKKVMFDAGKVKDAAKDAYDAAKAVKDGYYWVYDPDGKIAATDVLETKDTYYKKVSIPTVIKHIEGGLGTKVTSVEALMTLASSFITDVRAVEGKKGAQKIQEAITKLKADTYINFDGATTFELNAAKKLLEKALEYGKLGLSEVIEYLDEEIEELDEEIEIYAAIADTYKAIMNYYLGIEDEDVAGETGPLDGEGDDEE